MTAADRHLPVILAALAVAAAPHFLRLPGWVAAASIGLGLYTLAGWREWLPWPGRAGRLILTGLALLAVLAGWGPAPDRQAAVALFVLMASLKPLEISTHRDRVVALFMGYLLILTALFFTAHLMMGGVMVAAVAVVTAAMIHIHHPDGAWRRHLRLAATLTVQALPIMAVLFLLFPRIQGSLWGFGRGSAARTGFSDSLALGDISQLVPDSSIAFRAEFETPLPAPSLRYWRGMVLWAFDGRTWQRGMVPPTRPAPFKHNGDAIAYTITLEPHGQRWLFALDTPRNAPPGAVLSGDHTLRARAPVSSTVRYRVESTTDARTGPLGRWELAATGVNPETNPRSAALAREWAAAGGTTEQIVQRALTFFKNGGFVYSLTAPPLHERPLDAFLFETRRGYCEHYASALAFLLRAAGVPARVVLGYQGGEWNPYGRYLIIRQSDAHAWVEAWLPRSGWTRLDATAVVAPARLTQGAARSLPAGEFSDGQDTVALGPLADLVRGVVYRWDALNTGWQRWVTGYTFQRQQGLLKRLGLSLSTVAGMVTTAVIAAVLVALLAWFYLHTPKAPVRKPENEAQRLYRRFAATLARVGAIRAPYQGPRAFAAMAGTRRPDLATEIDRITGLYVRLRYRPHATAADLDRLRREVKAFRPRRRPPAATSKTATRRPFSSRKSQTADSNKGLTAG